MFNIYDEIKNDMIEKFAIKFTSKIGSPTSIMIHTIIFILSFVPCFFGINVNDILLLDTTIVSFEAIYLTLFVQLTLNIHSRQINEMATSVKDIQEDVEDIQEDVEGIQENVEQDEDEDFNDAQLTKINETIQQLTKEIIGLKKQQMKK